MAASIKVSSKITKFQATGPLPCSMVELILVNGKIIRCTAKVYLLGKMDGPSKEHTVTIISMVTASLFGLTVGTTKATGRPENNMAAGLNVMPLELL